MRKFSDVVFSDTASGVVRVNKKLVIQQANRAIGQLLGYTKEELVNVNLHSLVYQEPYEDGNLLKNFCFTEAENNIELGKG